MQNIDWSEIVYRQAEGQKLDYKSAVDWLQMKRSQKAKFARHCMAMANTHGGYIVVGVGEDEDGIPSKYTGLTDRQLHSFDPTIVGQTVNRYADPSVDFDIVRPTVDGKSYVIFVVRSFNNVPHICCDSCGGELQQGVFYIRTPEACSRAACRASEVQGLVQRALRNQRLVLGRMLRGVLYEGKQYAEPLAENEFKSQISSSQNQILSAIGPRNYKSVPLLEVVAYPPEYNSIELTLSDIKRALQNVVLPTISDFPFWNDSNTSNYFTNQSYLCKGKTKQKLVYAQAFQSALFHHVSAFRAVEDAMRVDYSLLIQRVATAISVLGQYYLELGMEEELLTFQIRVINAQERVLVNSGHEQGDSHTCFIREIIVHKRRTVADLGSSPQQHACKVIKEICERFNLSAGEHINLSQKVGRFLD